MSWIRAREEDAAGRIWAGSASGEALPSLQPSRNHSPSSCRLADDRIIFKVHFHPGPAASIPSREPAARHARHS